MQLVRLCWCAIRKHWRPQYILTDIRASQMCIWFSRQYLNTWLKTSVPQHVLPRVKDPVGVSYLLRCPYCQCREFPWLRHNLLPSTPAGRHSASHFGPVCISHCCCTNQGSPLLKQTKKKHKWFKYCNNLKRKNKYKQGTLIGNRP